LGQKHGGEDMIAITDIEKLNGKTIKEAKFVEYKTSIALIFKDGTYTIIRSVQCFDETEVELDTLIEDYALLEAGIITKDEYQKIQDQKQKMYDEEKTKRELRQLEELKRKYGK
jgi:hypothetical protein